MAKTVLTVSDISCEHCERTITRALTPVQGIRPVNVDIPARQVHVDYDESLVEVHKMKDVLQEEDYPVDSVAIAARVCLVSRQRVGAAERP